MFHEVIDCLIQNQKKLVSFINTLSVLEYKGACKMIKSIPEKDVSFEVLEHIHEETKHAFLLKKLVIKLSKNHKNIEYLALDQAKQYFNSIENICKSNTDSQMTCYYLASYLIEHRAIEVYSYLHKQLKDNGFISYLGGLIQEEEGHLQSFQQKISHVTEQEMNILKQYESKQFMKWMKIVEGEICKA